MTVEEEIAEYEKKNGPLPAHNKSVLRDVIIKENRWWDGEEQRVLRDSNRYPED